MTDEQHEPDIDCECERCVNFFIDRAESDAIDRYIEDERERRYQEANELQES